MITGLRRLDETTIRAGGSGDNWYMTWAGDGKQYAGLCDGRAWPAVAGYTGEEYNSRLYAINGDPPAFTFEHLPGYPELTNEWGTPRCSRYYGFGIIALGERIYQFLSTPNHPFQEPQPRFAGAKLIFSPDLGRSWRNQDGGPLTWEP